MSSENELSMAKIDLWYVREHKGTASTVYTRAVCKALKMYQSEENMPDKLKIVGFVLNRDENTFVSVFTEIIDVPDWISRNTDSKGRIDISVDSL